VEEGEGEKDDDDEDMPVVGWVVHGHFWYLHIAYRRKDGNIVSTPGMLCRNMLLNEAPRLSVSSAPFPPARRRHTLGSSSW
jgi:hypothetical protein